MTDIQYDSSTCQQAYPERRIQGVGSPELKLNLCLGSPPGWLMLTCRWTGIRSDSHNIRVPSLLRTDFYFLGTEQAQNSHGLRQTHQVVHGMHTLPSDQHGVLTDPQAQILHLCTCYLQDYQHLSFGVTAQRPLLYLNAASFRPRLRRDPKGRLLLGCYMAVACSISIPSLSYISKFPVHLANCSSCQYALASPHLQTSPSASEPTHRWTAKKHHNQAARGCKEW